MQPPHVLYVSYVSYILYVSYIPLLLVCTISQNQKRRNGFVAGYCRVNDLERGVFTYYKEDCKSYQASFNSKGEYRVTVQQKHTKCNRRSVAQGIFAPPPPPWRHGTARHKTGRHTEIPNPPPPIPTLPDPTRNGPLETTTMECQTHTNGPNAFVFLSRTQC